MKQHWLNWRMVIIDDPDLSFGEKAIALYLNSFMNDRHDFAFPSIATVCGEMGLTDKTATKHLVGLEEKGYLKREKRFGKSIIYYALIPEKYHSIGNSPELEEFPYSIGNIPTPVSENLRTNNQKNKQSNKQLRSKGEDSVPESPPQRSRCPYGKIVELYHSILPECPKVVELTDKRKRAINARWKNGMNGLDNWEAYFEHVRESRFLMGKVDPPRGRKQFLADIDFLIRESTIVSTQEGKYHR